MKIISNSKQCGLFLCITTFAVLFIDQTLKYIFNNNLIEINIYRNYNFFWGLSSKYFLLTTAFLIIFFYFKKNYLKSLYKISKAGTCLMFVGITSNTIDILSRGYVIDYIPFYSLFSFNIADLTICTGAFILGWKILKK